MAPQHIWTWPVILTLCISLLALAVSGASLTSQIVSWRRSCPRVSVKTVSGIGGRPGVRFVGVEATNSGRLGTEIEQFGFQLPNGRHIQAIHDYLGQPVELPMPLAPGRAATIFTPPSTYGRSFARRVSRGRTSGPTSPLTGGRSAPDTGALRETRSISASGSRTFTHKSHGCPGESTG
jgi:hypothetical protein